MTGIYEKKGGSVIAHRKYTNFSTAFAIQCFISVGLTYTHFSLSNKERPYASEMAGNIPAKQYHRSILWKFHRTSEKYVSILF